MEREHISPWRRTRRRHDAFRRRRKGTWSRFRKWANYIIATNDAPREWAPVDSRLGVDAVYAFARPLVGRPSVQGNRVHHGTRRTFRWGRATVLSGRVHV